MRNALLILMAISLLGIANAATQNAELLKYQPANYADLPMVYLMNAQDAVVQIKDLEIVLFSNTSEELVKIDKIVEIPTYDNDGHWGWIPIQLDGVSQNFLKKGRWNVTRIEITGYLSGGDGFDPEEYKTRELIDAWNIDPAVMGSVNKENTTIVNGGVLNPPEADYLI